MNESRADKRCFVVSICASSHLIEHPDSVNLLNSFMKTFKNKLKATDYVCFNVGNKIGTLQNDVQDKLMPWRKVNNNLKDIKKYATGQINNRAISNLLG